MRFGWTRSRRFLFVVYQVGIDPDHFASLGYSSENFSCFLFYFVLFYLVANWQRTAAHALMDGWTYAAMETQLVASGPGRAFFSS